MTRKKKTTPHSKIHQMSGSDGWTHVIKGPKSYLSAHPPYLLDHPPKGEADSAHALQKYIFDFTTKHQPHWLQSQCCRDLTRILRDDVVFPKGIVLTKCVCLGLGSLNARYRSSSYQLAALISIFEILCTLLIFSSHYGKKTPNI